MCRGSNRLFSSPGLARSSLTIIERSWSVPGSAPIPHKTAGAKAANARTSFPSPSQRSTLAPRLCPALSKPRSSSLSLIQESYSSARIVGACASTKRNKTATLRFSVTTGRGTNRATTSRKVVLPQPFSGDEILRRGEQMNALNPWAWAHQSASASAAPVGSAMYRRKVSASSLSTSGPLTRSGHNSTSGKITALPCNAPLAVLSPWRALATSLSRTDSRQPSCLAASLRRRSNSRVGNDPR